MDVRGRDSTYFQHDNRIASNHLGTRISITGLHVDLRREKFVYTTIPNRTFSPPAFSSTASSSTTFRNTYKSQDKYVVALELAQSQRCGDSWHWGEVEIVHRSLVVRQ